MALLEVPDLLDAYRLAEFAEFIKLILNGGCGAVLL